MTPQLLSNFFNTDELSEEAMCFFEAHGFFTSLAVLSGSLDQATIEREVFSSTLNNTEVSNALFQLKTDIEQALLNGEFPDISDIDIEGDDDPLALWASGFMQGVFLQEDLWFANHPEDIAELTLPILSCSGLLDDELDDINLNDDVLEAMAERIPDCVIDLYLLFNAQEES